MRSDDSDVVREERRRRDDEFERRTLAEKLTVIITTSPLPRHPSRCEMLDAICGAGVRGMARRGAPAAAR